MAYDWEEAMATVRGALRRRGRSNHEAEDLVQDAWIRLMSYERGHSVANPGAFLMTVAFNLSVDAHRAQQKRGEELPLDAEPIAETAPDAVTILLSRERARRLSVCLARLDRRTRAVFLAHRVDGLSYREIGIQEGISIGSAERHVAKAALLVTGWMEGWYP